MSEMQNQGLQTDGNSPEPSQKPEGNNPDPSQEKTDQLTDQELEQMLPDQDGRGVPKENVLSEVLRKINKLTDDITSLKSASQSYRQSQSYSQQPYQQPVQQQSQSQIQIIPRNPAEIAEIVDKEAREKYGEAFIQGQVDYWELQKFQNKRVAELSNLMMRNVNNIQTERFNSLSRIKGLYPDLNNINTPLTQAVFNEINRRAISMGLTAQEYVEKDPYVFESVTPSVASQLGIGVKVQTQPKLKPKQSNLPPNSFEGRQTIPKEEIKPSEEDIAFGQGFGIKPETLTNIKKNNPDPRKFIANIDNLLS